MIPSSLLLIAAPLSLPLAGPQEATSEEKAGPIFDRGEAQIVPAFRDKEAWIQESLWVETEFDSDGDGALDRMYVDVTRQAQTETEGLKVPVVYNTSPYSWGTPRGPQTYFWDAKHDLGATPPERKPAPVIERQEFRPLNSSRYINTFVPRGFAVVHSASPGTGYSQGCPTVGGMNEALAPKAVIDWLNGRAKGYTKPVGGEEVTADWCTGKVGMIGTSYNGTLPLAAATTGVEGLEAIIPVAPNTSYYHYYRSNGLVRHPGGYMGEDIDVLYDFINSGDPDRRDWCNRNVRDMDMNANQDRESGDYSAWWAARDYGNQLSSLNAAVLMAHAFNDWNVVPDHSVRIYRMLAAKGVDTMSYFHQGGHGGDPPFWMVNQWFTKYLYGQDGGILDGPRAWIVREGMSSSRPTPYADFPNPLAESVALNPTGSGKKLGKLGFSAENGKITLVDDAQTKGGDLAKAKTSDKRLLFATPKLKMPVHISGYPEVTIRMASNRPAANLSVWLVSLPWEDDTKRIYDNVITRGWADPQNARSITESTPLEPGEFVTVSFRLQPDDQIVPAGARIGLMIFSTDPEFTLQPSPGTELTVDLAGTELTLPVVGGRGALRMAIGDR